MEQAQGTSTSGNTKAGRAKARNYFITFWNKVYPGELPKQATYLITCEDTTKEGKWHGHAFIYFRNPVGLKSVKTLFGKDCHVERPVKNSDCIEYVKGKLKPDNRKYNILEHGKPPMNNGVHNMESILECESLGEVIDMYPDTYVKFKGGIEGIFRRREQQKVGYFKPIEVEWIYGKTGKGKTRMCCEAGAKPVIYNNGFFSDWGERRIIALEELRGEIPYPTLLMLTDGYHNYYSVNIKGGQKVVDLDKVMITSPYSPEECYPRQCGKKDSINQLTRRITNLVCVDEPEEDVSMETFLSS